MYPIPALELVAQTPLAFDVFCPSFLEASGMSLPKPLGFLVITSIIHESICVGVKTLFGSFGGQSLVGNYWSLGWSCKPF